MNILDTVAAALASNQLLAGGVGTLAFGAAMYLFRAVPEKALEILGKTLWTKVFVESMSNEYADVDAFIEGRRLNFFSRSLELKDGGLKTGFGGGWGLYDGVLFSYAKTKSTQQVAPFETITVSFLTRDRSVVERFMRDCKPEEHRNAMLNQIPLGRLGSAQEIAHAVAFLASPGAGYITGETLHVNGGMYMG